ncbi:M15 family metallopeptidase [Phenylobacterium sp.]|jgi:D-alanyl-D-alanine dipeptidase|uniref:M15 family metallopeptidase n=1 Tax=Phenylobacterium sp. TaxID=1871053 RepID=UPI002E33F8BF|nr:M15 family metallopeptidase [Phenylobacterium sp.]HEX3366318.1 M15 family metallopeptidase [Phenylobacterium sp.]
MPKLHGSSALLLILSLIAGAAHAAALPASPPAEMQRLIGQYGTPQSVLTVSEDRGRLYADGRALAHALLTGRGVHYAAALPGGERTAVDFDLHGGQAAAVSLMHERWPRHDFSAEVVAGIQAKVKADPAAVRAAALAATPPKEPTPKRASDLVDLTTIDPGIKLDIGYATPNNFMGFPLYERAGAYLQRPAAEALGRAQKALAAQGYGLLIHDAYRPWFVTKMFWDATPPEDHVFVADPAQGSRHNRGCAVDLTLYDLKTGKPVEMTGRYDEMSTRSYADFPGGTSRQRALRGILRAAMEAEGFTVYPQEWWHFDYKDYASYGIGTVTFTELAQRR